MKLSLGQAAKETGKSKATISKAIKSGRLSASKNDKGGWDIDPAELFRVYNPVNPETVEETRLGERQETPKVNPKTPPVNSALETEVKLLRELLSDKDKTIDDLRRRLDQEAEERRKLTLMLTHQREPHQEKPQQEAPEGGAGGLFGTFRYIFTGQR